LSKYLISILIIISCTNQGAIGQESNYKNLYHLELGINTTFLSKKVGKFGSLSSSTNSFSSGITGGIKIVNPLSNYISFSYGLIYSSKGGLHKIEADSIFQEKNSNSRAGTISLKKANFFQNYLFNYLEVPIEIQLNLSNLINKTNSNYSKKSIWFSFGILPGYNLRTTFKFNELEYSVDPELTLLKVDNEQILKEQFGLIKKLIFSHFIGLYFFHPKNQILAYAKWTKSINNVFQVREPSEYNWQATVNSFSIGFGYILDQ